MPSAAMGIANRVSVKDMHRNKREFCKVTPPDGFIRILVQTITEPNLIVKRESVGGFNP